MSRKRHTAEEIIGKLRTAEIELAKGLGTAEVVRKLGIDHRRWCMNHSLEAIRAPDALDAWGGWATISA